MGSCLSSENGQLFQSFKQSSTTEASMAVVSGPNPGLLSNRCILEGQAQYPSKYLHDIPDIVSLPCKSSQSPSQPIPPVSPVMQPSADVVSIANDQASVLLPSGGPRLVYVPQDSQITVYSEVIELEPAVEPGLPTLPPAAQLPSASVTPVGHNVLMQLDRAAILRNRMGPCGALQPVAVKPSLLAPEGAAGNGSCPARVDNQILSGTQQPPSHINTSNGMAADSSPFRTCNSVMGGDITFDSGLLDVSGALAPGASAMAVNNALMGNPALVPQSGGSTESTGVNSTGGCHSVGASVLSGACSGTGKLASPLYNLGLETTLHEMQQMALIGSGGGGCVYIGRWRGVTVAIKFIVSSNDDQLTRSQREALLSRLASHPHVVQTYATSVTQLTEQLFKSRDDDAPGDMLQGRISALDPNISHDLLAGLTSGSWIHGELQMAINGGASTVPGTPPGGALLTIMETNPPSVESVSTSMTTASGRGGATYDTIAASSVSVNHTMTYESDGPMSSSSTTAPATRARSPDAVASPRVTAMPAGQVDSLAGATGSVNLSCHTSGASSTCGVGGAQNRVINTVLARGGLGALGSVPSPGLAPAEPLAVKDVRAGGGGGGGGSIQPDDAAALYTVGTAAIEAPAMVSAPKEENTISASVSTKEEVTIEQDDKAAAVTTAPPSNSHPDGAVAAAAAAASASSAEEVPIKTDQWRSAPAAVAKGMRAPAGGIHSSGVADSFDASFVRHHLGRAKYSIHQVLRQLGALEGQFLTMVVMEYCDGGSLLAALKEGPFHRDTTSWGKRMLLRSTVRTALEIAHGMQHLHLSGLVHGDLKPGNVLLKGSNQDKRMFVAKVSDLGTAHPLGTADEMDIDDGQIGSIAYMAPEVFRGRIMKASDVYSFGVVLWQLACGTGAAPFEGAHPVAIALGVMEGRMTLRWPPGVFRPLQQLGELCLQTDPAGRPSFKSVVGALEKLERHMQRLAMAAASGGGSGSCTGNAAVTSPPGPFGTPVQLPAVQRPASRSSGFSLR
ncbi:hypothetical protein VaNZ11_006054 [Volvox africanus]|uniref:Protein kinase domain-containing protein n=1 Tax=Volvox africanus TaxID=51714 RepID=A0ABQ5RZX0_9CHLO|nr:hypothetical protein VaNZ11_006054 [Volvox africanus]